MSFSSARCVTPEELPSLLRRAAAGDHHALDDAVSILYEELHKIARAYRSRWRGNQTLDTTALVHEAYMKLRSGGGGHFGDEKHMLAVAARAMRQLLSNYARDSKALKRSSGAPDLSLSELSEWEEPWTPEHPLEEMIDLNAVMERLEGEHPRACRALECHLMIGLTIDETAEVLGVSRATVKRDLKNSSDWLARSSATA